MRGRNVPPNQASITLDQTDPNFGDQVTFTVEGADASEFPTIQLQAFQNGVLVFSASHAAFEGGYGYGDPFPLGPSYAWPSGAADGKAILGHRHKHSGKYIEDAETEFPISA